MDWVKAMPARGDVLFGTAVSCSDGDGFGLASEAGRVRIRLVWIDAPEMNQPYGGEARRALWGLLSGIGLRVEVKGHDKYGRSLGLVVRDDGVVVNLRMIEIGAAHYYAKFGHGWTSMREAEASARGERRGLWALAHVHRPWDWRRQDNYHVRVCGVK